MNLFQNLTPAKQESFRKWARKNYKPFTPINGLWHPIVQRECARINEAAGIDIFSDLNQPTQDTESKV